MASEIVSVEPVHNPRMRYTLIFPNGAKQGQMVRLIGYLHDRQAFVDQQLHGHPLGTHVENLRQVDRRGRDLPKQPKILLQDEPRTAAKFGHVAASTTTSGPRAAALPALVAGQKPPTVQGPKRPRRLVASTAVEKLVEDEALEVYPGVVPYAPPDPSRELDHDEDGNPTPPPDTGMETPDPEKATELPPGEAAVQVVGEPINPQDKPPTQSRG